METANTSTKKINSTQRTTALKDFLITMAAVFALFPVFYIFNHGSSNIFSLGIFVAILIPTILALIHGAPFVPTPIDAVKKMVRLANIKANEKVYDLGCGDGRIVYLANKNHQANAIGFELSPLVYALARIRKFLWRSKANIVFGSFKRHNLKDANVIFCYLLPETLKHIQPKLDRELQKGTRIISYAFPIGTWKEVHKEERDAEKHLAPIWVYEKD